MRARVAPAAAIALGLALAAAGCERRPPPTPATGRPVVLCAGDSITAASYPGHLQRLLDEAGLALEVVNAGVNGHTSGEYLAWLRGSGVLETANPRWVLLQLGTNDVRIDGDATPTERFRENLGAILDLVAAHRNPDGTAPRVLLATIPPLPGELPRTFDASSRLRVEGEINPAIRAIARERGIPLVDNHALFASRPALLPDVHPSEEGYRELAGNWYAALAPLLGARGRR